MSENLSLFGDVIGTIGMLFVCYAYYVNVTGKATFESIQYLSYNLFGATLLLISLCINFNLGSFIIEIFWIVISIKGLILYYRKEKK